MSNHLEQFIKDHREEFDSEEPVKKVWDNIPQPAVPAKAQQTKVIRFQFLRWSVAAAVLVLVAGGFWFFNRSDSKPASNNLVTAPVPSDNGKIVDSPIHQQVVVVPVDTASSVKSNPGPVNTNHEPTAEDDAAQELIHFAGLVEIKHRQLKKIEKDEPLLYRQFAGDVNKLDSVYHSLKRQLPKNPNREQLLEAMIQNLQLQMGLLNHQLDIIKQINHSKKSAYEKAYKSV
ncbi:MAG TPA: hypothetical protein VK543_10415 [Puia sp.]|nr:hypothetical protein [Puia sp.]